MVEDLTQLYEIMANKSSAYIEDMEAQLDDDADPATRHRLYYLLSLQYANKGDKKGAARYTELDSSSSKNSRRNPQPSRHLLTVVLHVEGSNRRPCASPIAPHCSIRRSERR